LNIRINFSFDQRQGFWPVRGILKRMAEEVNATQGAAFAFFPISLVVAEILNNSIQHGMTFKSAGQLRVRHLSCQNCIEITLIDTGCLYRSPQNTLWYKPVEPL
jgi:anti-sigma regulatory factor (Ser/Thr protein kinase)